MDIVSLHKAIAAVCPIDGVSVGDPNDKSTWRIDFSGQPTDQQKVSAQSVVGTWNIGATPVPEVISDRQFFQQLAVLGIISQDEALASNAAVIPPPLLNIINGMP